MADEIDFLTVSNPAPSPITEEELATFLAVGKSWQVQEDEIEKEAERVYELTELAILDRQRNDLHQREAERDAREADRDQREAKRDKREAERDASPDDFHDGWMKRAERVQARNARETLRNTREAERGKREAERKRCKALADARRQAEMDRREAERDQREAERDRLAREADQQAYKTNRENRVTLLQIVKKQQEAFDDRGADGEDFPDAYINYLLECGDHKSSKDGKILEKARELYRTKEPIHGGGMGYYKPGWTDELARIDRQTGKRLHQTPEQIKDYILYQWYREKDGNSVIFKKYVNMVKKEKMERERLEKTIGEDIG